MSNGANMNERDAVLHEMLHGNPDLDEQRAQDLIDALVDAVAHELADEQRAMIEQQGDVPASELIDHIDPHVPFEEGGPAPREQPGVGDDAA